MRVDTPPEPEPEPEPVTVIDNAEDKGDVFPAASVAVAVNEYEPPLRADDAVSYTHLTMPTILLV